MEEPTDKLTLECIKRYYDNTKQSINDERYNPLGRVIYKNYEDFFLSDNKVWCTTWARVIRKDKIVYFCEDTLMEDRVWSYRQADNVDLEKVINIKEVCYTWNRMNTTNSVSTVRNSYWNASAWCHIGHQLQLLDQLKHKEMIPILKERIKQCQDLIKQGIYQQY